MDKMRLVRFGMDFWTKSGELKNRMIDYSYNHFNADPIDMQSLNYILKLIDEVIDLYNTQLSEIGEEYFDEKRRISLKDVKGIEQLRQETDAESDQGEY